jgi:YkoP domain
MSGEAAFIAGALGGASSGWPDDLWAGSIALVDAMLRSYYGVYEFDDDPACIFRVALAEARTSAALADGTTVQIGEVIGNLHLWNEHLPRFSAGGPDLAWACTMRDRVRYSLAALAEHVTLNPAWREVTALCGEAAFSPRLGLAQLRRVALRYGFERVATDPSWRRRLHKVGDSVAVWGLTRAFNPAALARQPFLRERHELWISRTTLIERYADRRRAPIAAVQHAGA